MYMQSECRDGVTEQKTRFIPIDDMMPIIYERISAGGTVEINARGTSMLPLLKEGRDSVVLRSPEKPLKKYDVILYKRDTGSYVLHRIVKIKDGLYTCLGDAQNVFERGVREDQIIAVMSGYKREGKFVGVDSFGSKFYCVFHYYFGCVRRFFGKMRCKARRLIRKIFEKKK